MDYTVRWVEGLRSKGIDAVLAAPKRKFEPFLPEGLPFFPLFISNYYRPDNVVQLVRLLRFAREFSPDIIHTQSVHTWLAPLLPWLSRVSRLLITFHDVTPHPGEEHLYTRISQALGRRYGHGFIVHGKALGQQLEQHYHIPSRKIWSIPMPEHNTSRFLQYRDADITREDKTVLFFGRIQRYKGLEYLLKAEPLISGQVPNARIIVAGAGDLKPYQGFIVHPEVFEFHNRFISYQEGATLFQRASLVVLPYVEASQSGVVITAYGFGLPVIATSVGALPELVEDGVTGCVVPPCDAPALADKVVQLLTNPTLRSEMGQNALRKLHTDLSWERISPILINIYRHVIS